MVESYTHAPMPAGDHPHQADRSGGDTVPVRRHPAARRLTLRVDRATGDAWVSAPPHVCDRDIARFVDRHADWLAVRRAHVPGRVPFADGAVIPILGARHVVRHRPDRETDRPRAPVVQADGLLVVTGHADHVSRRIGDFLKARALDHLSGLALAKSARVGCSPAKVSVRDTRTRWGSCSQTGRLSFCWRLILAPPEVSDYVAAHEVAHLVEMHHGPAFWTLCGSLSDDMSAGQTWLRRHGASLRRFG